MKIVPVDVLLVTEGGEITDDAKVTIRDDVKEAMTRIQKQSSKMKAAMDDVINGLEYASHSLIVKYDVVDAVESARKSTIDHMEETAVTTSGKQSRERIHLLTLSNVEADDFTCLCSYQRLRYGQSSCKDDSWVFVAVVIFG